MALAGSAFMRNISLTAAALLGLSILAQAAPAGAQRGGYAGFRLSGLQEERYVSSAFAACADASGGVTSELRDCSAQEYRRLDGRLNRAYGAAMARRGPAARVALRNDQRAWLRTRWRRCARLRPTGGTADLLNRDGCVQSELIRRIAWLERR